MLLAIHVTLTTAMRMQVAPHSAVSTLVRVTLVTQATESIAFPSHLITVPHTTVTTLPLVRSVGLDTTVSVSTATSVMVLRSA